MTVADLFAWMAEYTTNPHHQPVDLSKAGAKYVVRLVAHLCQRCGSGQAVVQVFHEFCATHPSLVAALPERELRYFHGMIDHLMAKEALERQSVEA